MRIFRRTTSNQSSNAAAAARPARRARRGGAVLEMAILAPVLIYLSFGAVEYGYFMYVKNTVFSAARDGARAAIARDAELLAQVAQAAGDLMRESAVAARLGESAERDIAAAGIALAAVDRATPSAVEGRAS